MATVNRYTKSVIAPRATAPMVDIGAAEEAGIGFNALADLSSQATQQIAAVQEKKQTRYDTIQRARAVSGYQTEIDNEFAKFSQENDMTDPEAPKMFGQLVRKKGKDYIAKHVGSEDSMVSLELQITGLADQYSMRMSETSRGAQKEFITNAVNGHINRITNEVYNDPNNLDIAFKQLNGLMTEYGSALDSVDEMTLIETAQSMVVEGAINSFIDVGDYESAQELVNSNDRFIEAMPPKQQMSLLSRINRGISMQDEEASKMTRNMNAIKSAAESAGVNLSGAQVFSAATGIKPEQTPEQKITSFQKSIGLTDQQMTPEIAAKIGFGVDLPSNSDIDMNKDRLPDGGYTPKGIGAIIKPAYENAANAKIMIDKVLLQSQAFLDDGNKQAGLAAQISFQKLIDDGAMVREGDIKLSAEGLSAYDRLQLNYEKTFGEGGTATPTQVAEMMESSKIFGQSVMEASKTYIDPYLEEAHAKGYRMLDIGLPRQSYDDVFGNISTNEDKNKRNTEIEEKAKSYGMTVNEYLTAGAKKRNMSVQDVAKQLGYTGKLGE